MVKTYGRVIPSTYAEAKFVEREFNVAIEKNQLLVSFNIAGRDVYGIVPKDRFDGFTAEEMQDLETKGAEVAVTMPVAKGEIGLVEKVTPFNR